MPTTPLPAHGTRARPEARTENPPEAPGHADPVEPSSRGRHADPTAGPRHGEPVSGPRHGTAVTRSTEPADAAPEELDDEIDVPPRLLREAGWILLVGGLVGSVVALVLLVEKISSLANPNYIPSCSIDPVLSCGTIMKTAQASVLGFPNPAIGMLTFPLVAMSGALVLSRVELPRWTWLALQFGSAAGLAFVGWLIVQSLAVIHALCPYCMVAWAAVTAIFWTVTVHNLAAGHLELGAAGDAVVRRRGWVLAAMYVVIVVAVVSTFPAYFGAMVGLG